MKSHSPGHSIHVHMLVAKTDSHRVGSVIIVIRHSGAESLNQSEALMMPCRAPAFACMQFSCIERK